MTDLVRLTAILFMTCALAGTARATAETVELPQAKPATGSQPNLAAAREALKAGRLADAISGADAVLRRQPAAREAVVLKMAALLQGGKRDQALSAYDAFIGAGGAPSLEMLEPVARADLDAMAAQPQLEPPLMAAVLERLAAAGSKDALESLRRHAAKRATVWNEERPFLLALVRLGDPAAVSRLGALLDAHHDSRPELIHDIQAAGVRSLAPKIAVHLGDPQPQVRTAAAQALGRLEHAASKARLQEMLANDVAIVQLFAAAALKRLGSPAGEAQLRQVLRTGAPEIRLMAAEAYQGSTDPQWTAALKEILRDRNEVNRLKAAELLACCEPSTARATLLEALRSPNVSLRGEASRILETTGLTDAQIARQLLGDDSAAVRAHGSGAVLKGLASRAR